MIWSAAALNDVQRLYRFLVLKNPDAARRAFRAIRSGVRALADQPQIGRPLEAMDIAFREWLIDFGENGYVVLYRVDGADSVILAVRQQKEVDY